MAKKKLQILMIKRKEQIIKLINANQEVNQGKVSKSIQMVSRKLHRKWNTAEKTNEKWKNLRQKRKKKSQNSKLLLNIKEKSIHRQESSQQVNKTNKTIRVKMTTHYILIRII